MDIFLDLWGVLLDEKKMNEEYNERAASILAARFGGDPVKWLDAYNSAWEDYKRRFRETDWDRTSWSDVADRLDARLITETLDRVGVKSNVSDMLSFARDLEFEVVSAVARSYPDAPGALSLLRKQGHDVHVVTQAGDWNAIGALSASGLLMEVKGIFSGSSQNTSKTATSYWTRVLERIESPPERCILVDDNLDFLKAATSIGIGAILMERDEKNGRRELPRFVQARMSTLTSLPPYVEKLSSK